MQKMQCEFSVRHRSQYGLHCTVLECYDVRFSYVTLLQKQKQTKFVNTMPGRMDFVVVRE